VQLLTRWIGHQLEQQRHYETLDRQNERLNEFAGVLAHDLRSPLTAARGYTELVTESTDGENGEHLRTVLESLDRMEELISETLALAREGADVGKREPVELEAVARDAWATVTPETATLRVENPRSILADRSRLRQLLENLFRNVDDHCGDETTVIVRGTEDGFEVADDGPGLPDSVAASLFGGDFGANRLGLGLLIVERVVSGHGWQGTVDTSDGTRFGFAGVGAVVDPPAVN
jgi:two-component system OmpR family sensor kinase